MDEIKETWTYMAVVWIVDVRIDASLRWVELEFRDGGQDDATSNMFQK